MMEEGALPSRRMLENKCRSNRIQKITILCSTGHTVVRIAAFQKITILQPPVWYLIQTRIQMDAKAIEWKIVEEQDNPSYEPIPYTTSDL